MTDNIQKKESQRKMGISARKAMDKEQAMYFSRVISEKLMAYPTFLHAKTIFSYQPFGGEVDISFFNEYALQAGKTVAFPICDGNGHMVAAVPEHSDAWETGKYGIKAPVKNRSHILDPNSIELIIVPCTVFNGPKKMRIGWGGGYYDRYLPQCKNATSIAVAYGAQQVNDICCEEWDVPLDAVATESSWY
ncbi:5-formyltetrahydrofolate cyclo-ligase [Lachnospiraceae bacterium ZAX-1]